MSLPPALHHNAKVAPAIVQCVSVSVDVRNLNPGTRRSTPTAAEPHQLQVLDMEADRWGLAPGFDLVIAVNVLHLAEDIHTVLARIHALVSPGGVLIFGEVCAPEPGRSFPLMDYTFGLLPSFQARSERGGPLLIPEEWHSHLLGAGFATSRFLALTRSDAGDSRNYGGIRLVHLRETTWRRPYTSTLEPWTRCVGM